MFLSYTTDYRRDRRRPIQNSGAGRPASRGGRKSEHHVNINHRRDQHGTRVFKNSPTNIQKGMFWTEKYNSRNNEGDTGEIGFTFTSNLYTHF